MPSRVSEQRLLILDTSLSATAARDGRIYSCRTDGSDLKTLVGNLHHLPDGITVDHDNGHIYWTNMGTSLGSDSGSISRCDLDGTNITTIVPTGTIWTPKQITIAKASQKLYWCDREGMRVMRSNLDGSDVETLIQTGKTDDDRRDLTRWCVGIAVDEKRGYFYWSQKGPAKGNLGRIFRAKIPSSKALPLPQSSIETLFESLPEPIDLELDETTQMLYWTDRGDPPKGNSLNRAFVGDSDGGRSDGAWTHRELLATRLHEAIGLALDLENQLAYVTDLAGGVYRIDVSKGIGSKKVLFAELGDITGIALAEYPV